MPLYFKILNISIFDGDWNHTKSPINFLKFVNFQIFELYCFWNLDTIGEQSAPSVIQMISVEECYNTT